MEQDGKRLSIDSGYAESNLSNGSNEKEYDEPENEEKQVKLIQKLREKGPTSPKITI